MRVQDKLKEYYSGLRGEMLEFLPADAQKVLDIGCGTGAFLSYIKSRKNIEAWGVEMEEEQAQEATKKLDVVLMGTCEEQVKNLPDTYFDAIYFNDVLEHLIHPSQVLEIMKTKLSDKGVIITSIPNVRYHKVWYNYIFKQDWQYANAGILDNTHLRFFTSKSMLRMFGELNFEVIQHVGINKSKSIKPYLYNLLFLFSAIDIFYPQFATVLKIKC